MRARMHIANSSLLPVFLFLLFSCSCHWNLIHVQATSKVIRFNSNCSYFQLYQIKFQFNEVSKLLPLPVPPRNAVPPSMMPYWSQLIQSQLAVGAPPPPSTAGSSRIRSTDDNPSTVHSIAPLQ